MRRRGREGRGLREEEEEREEGMLFFSFLPLSTSRDLSQLDSEDIIIHHRETKKQRIVLLVRTLNFVSPPRRSVFVSRRGLAFLSARVPLTIPSHTDIGATLSTSLLTPLFIA